jgi:hypothetical protein
LFFRAGIFAARGSTVSGTQVTASSFQTIMGCCNGGNGTTAAYNICWYEAAQYCAYLTVASSDVDVPHAVKNHIANYYLVPKSILNADYYNQTNGDKCRNYLKYALITPKCYRLPTSGEWTAAYDAKNDTAVQAMKIAGTGSFSISPSSRGYYDYEWDSGLGVRFARTA